MADDPVPDGTDPVAPPEPMFSSMQTEELGPGSARISFRVARSVSVQAAWGLEIPALDETRSLGYLQAGAPQSLELSDLEPGKRYIVRLSASDSDREWKSGYHWIFTPKG